MNVRNLLTRAVLLSVGLLLGTAAVSPAATSISAQSLNFGTVSASAPSPPQTITATVDAADTNRRVEFFLAGGAYDVVSNCPATPLPPGNQSCTGTVTFEPNELSSPTPGVKPGFLEVNFFPPSGVGASYRVPLTATVAGGSGGKGKKCKKGKKAASAAKKKCGKKK